jgi:hypothetical protein
VCEVLVEIGFFSILKLSGHISLVGMTKCYGYETFVGHMNCKDCFLAYYLPFALLIKYFDE